MLYQSEYRAQLKIAMGFASLPSERGLITPTKYLFGGSFSFAGAGVSFREGFREWEDGLRHLFPV